MVTSDKTAPRDPRDLNLSQHNRRNRIVSAALKLLTVDETRAKTHYAEHDGKPFFKGLVDYITSAAIVAMVVEGAGAIEGCRTPPMGRGTLGASRRESPSGN